MDQGAVSNYFEIHKPEMVFFAAAKVGGIMANHTYPADFIYQNLMIQTNVLHQSYVHQVKRLIFLGSSCIYPKHCPQPIKEKYLMTGLLEPSNSAYAVAKIAGIEMCWAYNRQYQTCLIPVMPTNLYGPNDNFDLANSHVLPALIRKFHEAKQNNKDLVQVWGTGTPKREFLHVDDLAEACFVLMNTDFSSGALTGQPLFNIGTGMDSTIRELAFLIKQVVGYGGDIIFDLSKPDGTPQKLLDVSRMNGLNWKAKIKIKQGITQTYNAYLASLDKSTAL